MDSRTIPHFRLRIERSGTRTGTSFAYICFGGPERVISSVHSGPYQISAAAAMAFAAALRETRKIDSIHSLHDVIYLEQASRLLPTYTETGTGDYQLVLGTWLSGGVHISTALFDRLCDLLSWMPKELASAIIREAGFPVSGGQYLVSTDASPTELAPQPAALEVLIFMLPARKSRRYLTKQSRTLRP